MNTQTSLLQTIFAYRGASEAFERLATDDDITSNPDLANATYMPHLSALDCWHTPATSEIEAREAIRLGTELQEVYADSLAAENLIRAGKRYLDARPKLTVVK